MPALISMSYNTVEHPPNDRFRVLLLLVRGMWDADCLDCLGIDVVLQGVWYEELESTTVGCLNFRKVMEINILFIGYRLSIIDYRLFIMRGIIYFFFTTYLNGRVLDKL